MLDTRHFAPTKTLRVTSFEQLTEVLPRFTPEYVNVEARNLSLTDDLHLKYNGNPLPMTQTGFTRLLRFLKLPDPFARSIPLDLLQHNFKRLGEEAGGSTVRLALLPSEDGTYKKICGALPLDFPVLDMPKLVAALQDQNRPLLVRAGISDDGLFLQTIQKEEVEVFPGDNFQSGKNLKYSPSGIWGSRVSLFMYQLICTNGVIAPTYYGGTTPGWDHATTPDLYLTRFLKGYDSLHFPWAGIVLLLKKSVDTKIPITRAMNLWQKVSALSKSKDDSKSDADAVFDWNESDRTMAAAQKNVYAIELAKAKKNLDPLPVEPLTERNYYKVFTNATEMARDMEELERRMSLEAAAGNFLLGARDLIDEE